MATSTQFKPQEEFSKTHMPESNGGKARQAADKAKDIAGNVADKARDVAGNVADKARDVAGNVAETAKDVASNVGHKAEDATHAVGSGLQSLAGTVRSNLPHSGVVGAATSTLASGLENTGKYLQEEGLKGMSEDVTNLIRRNPLPAVLIGIGLGFILARATKWS
jgi:uncharacterized protein YjbJ (UPF0337 family)